MSEKTKWEICGVPMTPRQIKAVQDAKAGGQTRIVLNHTPAQVSAWREAVDREELELRKLKEGRPRYALSIRHRRLAIGMTLEKLADATGMSRANLSRLECGLNTNPTIDTLDRIGQALGLSLLVDYAETTS